MPNKIITRKFNKNDYNYIIDLIDSDWNFNNYIRDSKAKHHLLSCFMHIMLFNQNYQEVVEVDGKVIGILLGKLAKKKNLLNNLKHIFLSNIHGIKCIKDPDCKLMANNFKNMQKTYKDLYKKTDVTSDCELTFFAVHHDYQGLGIGKKLFNNYVDYCIKNNAKTMLVYTDEQCNYGVYDYYKFKKIAELPITFNLYNRDLCFNVFLYTKDL